MNKEPEVDGARLGARGHTRRAARSVAHQRRRPWWVLVVALMIAGVLVPAADAQKAQNPSGEIPTPSVSVPRTPATPKITIPPTGATKPGTRPPITAQLNPGGVDPSIFLRGEASRQGRPDMAVAMGDSYVSGEGAEDFITGDGFNDYLGTFPGYTYRNPAGGSPATSGPSNQVHPYYCHRSRNSSIFAANIPGIEAKRQIACSGGQPYDLVFNSLGRDGRPSQISLLRTSAQRNDVDVILIGVGSNTARATFGSILGMCHLAFMIDAADSIGEGEIALLASAGIIGDDKLDMTQVQQIANRHGCRASDLPTDDEWEETEQDVATAVNAVIDAMADEGYRDGEYRIVLQNYTNPFATTLPAALRTETGGPGFGQKSDTDGSFKGLARERYAAGCPLHERSLTTARTVTNDLHAMVVGAANRVRSEHPDADVIMLDVRDAFAGGLICQDNSGPAGKFSNPIWFRNSQHQIQRTFPGSGNLNFIPRYLGLAQPCGKHWALCQESGHPNEAGHAILGDCLAGAASYSGNARMVRCSGNNGNVSTVGVGAGA